MTRDLELILASASPRRAELLRLLGLEFRVIPSHIDEEERPGSAPSQTVLRLARDKARALLQGVPGDDGHRGLIIAADTAIEFGGHLLGKPLDKEDAVRMLMRLRGRRHWVLTAVCVADGRTRREAASVVRSEVTMRRFGRNEAEEYAASGEPLDKAGSYAIQGRGSELIDDWSGCYDNIVGLPVCEVARLILHFEPTAPVRRDACRLPGGQLCPRLKDPRTALVLENTEPAKEGDQR
ncbi:MAG: Maf family protein [Acidobacteriota bacterium]